MIAYAAEPVTVRGARLSRLSPAGHAALLLAMLVTALLVFQLASAQAPPSLIVYPNPAAPGQTVAIQAIASNPADSLELLETPPGASTPQILKSGTGSVVTTLTAGAPYGSYVITSRDLSAGIANTIALIVNSTAAQSATNAPSLSVSPNPAAQGTNILLQATGNPSTDFDELEINGQLFGAGTGVVSYTIPDAAAGSYNITSLDTATGYSTSTTLVVYAASGTGTAQHTNLPFNPMDWFGIALIATLLIISVAALVYALSGLIASQNAKGWARLQIYEAILSIVLLLAFAALSYMFFLNPQHAYASVGLLPGTCAAPNINTIFNLSQCDIGVFTNSAYGYLYTFIISGYIIGFSPGIALDFHIPTQPNVGISTKLDSLVPGGTADILSIAASALLTALVLNQVQVILLSSSLLFLSLFVTIGIVARTFGFTRTFGGAMIAIGLGVGLIYPMLVTITYGFIDPQLMTANLAVDISNAVQLIVGIVFTNSIPAYLSAFVTKLGYLIMGLTFVPFLNFIIVDAFIVDFSKAIGERIDFMSMMTSFV